MGIFVGILAIIGGIGLYSRFQDIENLKKRVEALENEVRQLKEGGKEEGSEAT